MEFCESPISTDFAESSETTGTRNIQTLLEAAESNATLTNQSEYQLAVRAKHKSGSQSSTCASLLVCLESMKEQVDVSSITEVVSKLPESDAMEDAFTLLINRLVRLRPLVREAQGEQKFRATSQLADILMALANSLELNMLRGHQSLETFFSDENSRSSIHSYYKRLDSLVKDLSTQATPQETQATPRQTHTTPRQTQVRQTAQRIVEEVQYYEQRPAHGCFEISGNYIGMSLARCACHGVEYVTANNDGDSYSRIAFTRTQSIAIRGNQAVGNKGNTFCDMTC